VHTKQMSAPARVKAISESDTSGQFEAIVSVFGNVDSVGDVVMPGAFKDDLDAWSASGDPIPVIWSHRWEDPDYHIGHVLEASETDEGLLIRGQLDLDAPKAAQVFRLLKGRRVTQFSFAYDVLDGAEAERDGSSVYELRKLHVHEVGPTLLGANRETRLVDAKVGRVLSDKNLSALKEAQELIGAVITAADSADDGKATVPGPAKRDSADAQPGGPRMSPLGARLTIAQLQEQIIP
jgi:HK97 family phage prohead protease